MNQFKFDLATDIYVLETSKANDAPDLVALGTDHSVQILLVADHSVQSIASFHIGSRITALAWSPTTVSPSRSDEWLIELTAATANFGLHLLTKSPASDESVFAFGGGLSGHHGRVNDMIFCGGKGADSTRYVATVSDDCYLMIWDLYPTQDASNRSSPDSSRMSSPTPRLQPTAYVIAFPHPLTAVSSHPSSSKEFLVSDTRGSIFLTDWRSDPDESDYESWRLVELIEPYALAATATASPGDNADIVGALQGGKPMTGNSFPQGGHRFRIWCPTYPEYFAISTQSPAKGAVVNIHNTTYTQPTAIALAPRPHFIRDFDGLHREHLALRQLSDAS
ncbi:hypothetical protein B0H14DRAFT_2766264 [Mycena olivaceomarginata]|nr:hypothetical protein B0H14DRAFT_2766264 [Mycena olivaceomarginata]